MSNSTNIYSNPDALCGAYQNWYAQNQHGVSFTYNDQIIGTDELERVDSFCSDETNESSQDDSAQKKGEESLKQFLVKFGVLSGLLLVGVIIAKVLQKLFKKDGGGGNDGDGTIDDKNDPVEDVSQDDPTAIEENIPVSDNKDSASLIVYPIGWTVKPDIVSEQLEHLMKNINPEALGYYTILVISRWNDLGEESTDGKKIKWTEAQKQYWAKDITQTKRRRKNRSVVGAIPYSFLQQFIRQTVKPTNDNILAAIRDPERFAEAIKSQPDIDPTLINVDDSIRDMGILARDNLANIVGAAPDANVVAGQLEESFKKVNNHPDASFYLSRLAISNWNQLSSDNRFEFVSPVTTLPTEGQLPFDFIKTLMKAVKFGDDYNRKDVFRNAAVFRQLVRFEERLNDAVYFEKAQEMIDSLNTTWTVLATSVKEIFGRRNKQGYLPDIFVNLGRSSLLYITQPPLYHIKTKPWKHNPETKDEYEGIDKAKTMQMIVDNISWSASYPFLLTHAAIHIIDDWVELPYEVRKRFLIRDPELTQNNGESKNVTPRVFVNLWLDINSWLYDGMIRDGSQNGGGSATPSSSGGSITNGPSSGLNGPVSKFTKLHNMTSSRVVQPIHTTRISQVPQAPQMGVFNGARTLFMPRFNSFSLMRSFMRGGFTMRLAPAMI